MAEYWIDPSAATNGVGSLLSPFNTLPAPVASDIWNIKRGTTIVLSADVVIPAGSSGNPTRIRAYGDATLARPLLDRQSGVSTICLSVTDPRYIEVEDIDTYRGGYGVKITPAIDAFTSVGVRFRRMKFSRHESYGRLISAPETATGDFDDIEFHDCEAFECQFAGFHVVGKVAASGVRHYRCIAAHSGRGWPLGGVSSGAHGFSDVPHRAALTKNDMVFVSGTTYSYALPAARTAVFRVAAGPATPNPGVGGYNVLYAEFAANTGTPTTPAAGEYGVSAGVLYVNFGTTSIGTLGTTEVLGYAWGNANGNYYEECEAYGSIDLSSNNSEGHGMAADDYRCGNTYVRCRAYDNEGYGFSSHRGDSNKWFYCLWEGNNKKGSWSDFLVVLGQNHEMLHNTFARSAFPAKPQITMVSCRFAKFKNNLFDGSAFAFGGGNAGYTSTPYGFINDVTKVGGNIVGRVNPGALSSVSGHDTVLGIAQLFEGGASVGASLEPVGNSPAKFHGVWDDAFLATNAWELSRPAEFAVGRLTYNAAYSGNAGGVQMPFVARSVGAVRQRTPFKPPLVDRKIDFPINGAGRGTLNINASTLGGLKTLTIEMWLLVGTSRAMVAGDAVGYIGTGVPGSGNSRHFSLYGQPASEIRFSYTSAAGVESVAQVRGVDPKHVPASHWAHMVFVIDTAQALAADRLRYYINGAGWSPSYVSGAAPALDSLTPALDTIYLGSKATTNSEASGSSIGAVRLWNRALNASEVQALYGGTVSRVGLEHEYLFASGAEAVNSGNAGGVATLVGSPLFSAVKPT